MSILPTRKGKELPAVSEQRKPKFVTMVPELQNLLVMMKSSESAGSLGKSFLLGLYTLVLF
jgi:hypothetical protein